MPAGTFLAPQCAASHPPYGLSQTRSPFQKGCQPSTEHLQPPIEANQGRFSISRSKIYAAEYQLASVSLWYLCRDNEKSTRIQTKLGPAAQSEKCQAFPRTAAQSPHGRQPCLASSPDLVRPLLERK